MKKKRPKATTPANEAVPTEVGELPERWSVQRKTELILWPLRGEALDAVSHKSQAPAHELESWERVFLCSAAKRGPRTPIRDAALVEAIRAGTRGDPVPRRGLRVPTGLLADFAERHRA